MTFSALAQLSDETLHVEVKRLLGRANTLTAELLAHLAEVEARGIHRERACSSLYTYCVYELYMSEDEAQRRCRAARLARQFPVLLAMLAEASLHLTGLLLVGPHLTAENQDELLARVRFRTKREIEQIVGELAPAPDVPARIEPVHGEQVTCVEVQRLCAGRRRTNARGRSAGRTSAADGGTGVVHRPDEAGKGSN